MEITNIFLDVDYRSSWLSTIFGGLKAGFDEIDALSKQHEWFDGLWQCEYAEPIVGVAFVAAQAYIVGVVADLGKSEGLKGKELQDYVSDKKIELYQDDPSAMSSGKSRIILINATANYYKHQDEWSGWDPSNWIVKHFEAVGIYENSDFPCLKVTELLFDDQDCTKLDTILTIVTEWREHVVSKHKNKHIQYPNKHDYRDAVSS